MRVQARKLVTLLLLLELSFAHLAVAKDKTTPRFQAGRCRLSGSGQDRFPIPLFCLRLNAGVERSLQPTGEVDELAAAYARGYLGVHFGPYFSLHGQGLRRKLHLQKANRYDTESGVEHTYIDDEMTEKAFVQIGNSATNRFRLAVGRIDLPYGLQFEPSTHIAQLAQKTQDYIFMHTYAARLTYDNLTDTTLQLGIGSNNLDSIIDDDNDRPEDAIADTAAGVEEQTRDAAIAARIFTDLPTLDGVRLFIFFMSDEDRKRRFGAGVLNRSIQGDTTVFEWHRTTAPGQDELEQLFRILYLTAFKHGVRWLGEYEDVRSNYRMIQLGADFRFVDNLMFRLHSSYYYAEHDRYGDYFQLVSGFEVRL